MEYLIILIVILIILLAVLKANKKDASIDLNRLVEYLGGKDNIIRTEIKLSRFIVTLKDITKADKESISKLGAKGIVEINNQLKKLAGKYNCLFLDILPLYLHEEYYLDKTSYYLNYQAHRLIADKLFTMLK